jgi:hypothetical protein
VQRLRTKPGAQHGSEGFNFDGAISINAFDLIPGDKGYYTFAGSLTTPCSENVTWYVLKTPVQVAAGEIARFARSYPMNARPVQPINGRDIQATRQASLAEYRGASSRRGSGGPAGVGAPRTRERRGFSTMTNPDQYAAQIAAART